MAESDKFSHSAVSGNKKRGQPAKGGAGKGNWGKPGDEVNFERVLDKNDPNYDSEEDDQSYLLVSPSPEPEEPARKQFIASVDALATFKRAIKMASEEFLSSFDREEFVRCINDLQMTIYHQEIPRLLIAISLDKSEELQKKASSLLQYLYQHDTITSKQMQNGFYHLYNRLDDLKLDAPNAEATLKAFTNRAVLAEMLPEAFAHSLIQGSVVLQDADEVKRIKADAQDLVNEYFESADLAEAESRITEMKVPFLQHEIVKRATYTSMDRTDREREMTSYLIANLAGRVLSYNEIEKAFEKMLSSVEDLYNDYPKILHFLSSFLARAIVDEAIAPAFLARVNVVKDDMAYQVIKQANILVKKPAASARLSKVWDAGDRSVPMLKKAVRLLVTEYVNSVDATEAIQRIRELNAPYFHHEIVKRLIVYVADKQDKVVDDVITLFQQLRKEDVLSDIQLKLGLSRVHASISDIILDAPNAEAVLAKVEKACT